MDISPTPAPANATEPATATAPETPVAASPAPESAPQKKGFLASMLGSNKKAEELENKLIAEQEAHAATKAELATVKGELADFKALEAQLEAESNKAIAEANEKAKTAETAAAAVPQQVAAKVVDIVSGLGVDEEKLAPVNEAPPAKSAEFSHLKGRDRAAAAFAAQFAK